MLNLNIQRNPQAFEELHIGDVFIIEKYDGVFITIRDLQDEYYGKDVNAISLTPTNCGESWYFKPNDKVIRVDATLNIIY